MGKPVNGGLAGRDTVGQFFTGLGLLGRGLVMSVRSPRLLLLGLIPAMISGVLFLAAAITLAYFVWDLAKLVSWFADDWSGGARDATRILAAVTILGAAGLIGVVAFTAVTLLIGDPFYERISHHVEERFGGVPGEIEVPWWRSLLRSLVDSLRLMAASALIGLPLFLAGFIPLLGQTVVPVVGATIGGWFLALELVGVPFGRRGLHFADRRRVLREHRAVALGFGTGVFVCFLIPLGAILIMPAAVAGGALLARHVLANAPDPPAANAPAGAVPASEVPAGVVSAPSSRIPRGGRQHITKPTNNI